MARPRDSQRTKFLTAHRSLLPPSHDLPSVEHARHFLSKMMNSSWWRKRHPQGIHVLYSGLCCSHDPNYLYIGKGSRIDVVHMAAHVLAPADVALHGPEFVREYLALTERFLGREAKIRVIGTFSAHGVKMRTWSPEARERAKDRAAKNGTPFGAQRLELAKDGVVDLMLELMKPTGRKPE